MWQPRWASTLRSISPNASRRSSASSRRSMPRNRKTSISMISRGNPLFFRTFPRLIKTISLSLFCAKWLFYPLSRKIVIRYFVRNDIFSIFSAEIILFSCKFHKTISSFSCKFHQTIILFSCKECIYQTYFREVYNEKENIR